MKHIWYDMGFMRPISELILISLNVLSIRDGDREGGWGHNWEMISKNMMGRKFRLSPLALGSDLKLKSKETSKKRIIAI